MYVLHRELGGDGLAAAVDDDGPESGGGQERDVAQDGLGDLRDLHGAAAELDQQDGVVEFLDVGQGLDEDVGLGDDFVGGEHGVACGWVLRGRRRAEFPPLAESL